LLQYLLQYLYSQFKKIILKQSVSKQNTNDTCNLFL